MKVINMFSSYVSHETQSSKPQNLTVVPFLSPSHHIVKTSSSQPGIIKREIEEVENQQYQSSSSLRKRRCRLFGHCNQGTSKMD